MTVEKVKDELARIDAEKSRLAELERAYLTILELLQQDPAPTPAASASDMENIRRTIDFMNRPFTVETLYAEMDATGIFDPAPKPSISAALSRMAKQGLLTVVEPGSGRRPSTYAKTSTDKLSST
jgi:hypothetical protein